LFLLQGAVGTETEFSANHTDNNSSLVAATSSSLIFSPYTNSTLNFTNSEFFDVGQIPFGIFGANIGWASWDPNANQRGRHAEYGRRTTDLAGAFSIEMTIKLASNGTCSPGEAEWVPCV
jgi:hypothetical protein